MERSAQKRIWEAPQNRGTSLVGPLQPLRQPGLHEEIRAERRAQEHTAETQEVHERSTAGSDPGTRNHAAVARTPIDDQHPHAYDHQPLHCRAGADGLGGDREECQLGGTGKRTKTETQAKLGFIRKGAHAAVGRAVLQQQRGGADRGFQMREMPKIGFQEVLEV